MKCAWPSRWVLVATRPQLTHSDMLCHSATSCNLILLATFGLQVVLVPPAYLQQHALLVEEFRNSTHWPKHLLVRYQWVNVSPVEALKGLYVVSGAGEKHNCT